MPSLDIILVNRNSEDLLRRCVRSLAAADRAGLGLQRVCIVDDVSFDDSAEALAGAGLPLEVLHNPRRLGYGASCNRGARGSRADLLLFLNTDIEMPGDALTGPEAYLATPGAERVAIAGVQLREQDGRVARSCSRFPSMGTFWAMTVGLDKLLPRWFRGIQMAEWDHGATREVDQVIGAFMLMRRHVFEALGGYDERFFVYMEDLDLTLRARAQGWASVYLAGTCVVHLGGGTARRAWAESLFFSARSRIQFAWKHWGVSGGLLVGFGALAVEPLPHVAYYLSLGSTADARAALDASARPWRWVAQGAPAGQP